MKNRSILLIGLMFFASVVSAELKIGYVDFARVLKESPQVNSEKKKMQAEIKAIEKKLGGLQKKITKLQERMERDAMVMSESERLKIDNEIRQKTKEAKRTQNDFRDDVNARNNNLVNTLQRRVYKVSKEIAEEEGYDLLLHSGALHVSDQINITEKVINRLGNK